MMTRKHYKMVARLLRNPPLDSIERAEMAKDMATEFKRDNPRFDRARFLSACGVGE